MPPEDTHTTRASPSAASKLRSPTVSANGPSTWVAKAISWPWAEVVRRSGINPAQWISACTLLVSRPRSPTKAATASRSLTSHSRTTSCAAGTSAVMAAAAVSSRAALRPTRCTRAPRRAKATALAWPSPELAPVTTMSGVAANAPGSPGHHRRRSSGPNAL